MENSRQREQAGPVKARQRALPARARRPHMRTHSDRPARDLCSAGRPPIQGLHQGMHREAVGLPPPCARAGRHATIIVSGVGEVSVCGLPNTHTLLALMIFKKGRSSAWGVGGGSSNWHDGRKPEENFRKLLFEDGPQLPTRRRGPRPHASARLSSAPSPRRLAGPRVWKGRAEARREGEGEGEG